ncbi:MAG: hypothetical protein KGM24_02590 [Elusimicrobia bacterium]|nr:hypothetical protein [Elusimicrobiota bacterium]
MTPTHPLLRTLVEYRWWVLVPLSLWESTVVAFAAGMLASVGCFNIVVLGAFFLARDIVLDLAYYALGRYGGDTALARRLLAALKIGEADVEAIRRRWDARPARTMLVGKLSYGIAMSFIVAAGLVRMSLRKFVAYGALAAVVQYGTLLALGYYSGAASGGSIPDIVVHVQYVLAAGALALVAFYAFSFYARGRLLPDAASSGSAAPKGASE